MEGAELRKCVSEPVRRESHSGSTKSDRKGTTMTSATLSLRVAPFRLLTKAEAAHYCRRPIKKCEFQCPVPPIEMADGDRLWDVRDLDRWIDSLKNKLGDDSAAILARLE